ncbi:hypothetical protein [uncultured Cohaesibacter sp.]|uniref:hypothetical protein n=1 Tax=uncultured Cohaesibacter sp. TaxID=1002546 RepID=UPI002AABA356|nr:hypothetical protein [uncultured Cohaesibacter sp.]
MQVTFNGNLFPERFNCQILYPTEIAKYFLKEKQYDDVEEICYYALLGNMAHPQLRRELFNYAFCASIFGKGEISSYLKRSTEMVAQYHSSEIINGILDNNIELNTIPAKEITNLSFDYLKIFGDRIGSGFLKENNKIINIQSENENNWQYKDGILFFINKKDEISSIYQEKILINEKIYYAGFFIKTYVCHILKKK